MKTKYLVLAISIAFLGSNTSASSNMSAFCLIFPLNSIYWLAPVFLLNRTGATPFPKNIRKIKKIAFGIVFALLLGKTLKNR